MWANNLHILKSLIKDSEVKQDGKRPDGGASQMPYALEGAIETKSSQGTDNLLYDHNHSNKTFVKT
jgi:hypothetical protein